MSNYINENLLDASPYKKQQEEAKGLIDKWDKTGLLDGLNEDFQKSGMATLLENQARQLINENTATGGQAGGASLAAGSEEWSGVALPLVRRIFGEIAAQEFVSVQPMNLPSGLVFFLDFKYGKTRGGHTQGDSIHGTTGPNTPSGSSAPYGTKGFYGTGKYGYSVGTGSKQTINVTASFATDKQINFDTEVSASGNVGRVADKGALFKVSGTLSNISRLDAQAVRGWQVTTTAAPGNVVVETLDQFNTFDTTTGMFSTIVSASQKAAGAVFSGSVAIEPIIQNIESDRGDLEDSGGNATVDSLQIPEVDIQMRSSAIVAKTRKLKAVWTPELAQDLNAYHSVDAEAELTSMLSEYISMEIDLEILDMLVSDAVTVDYWSARQGNDYNASTNKFENTTFYGTRFEWWQTLVQKVQKVSNEIHRLTLRGGANFVVVSPKVATILESLPGYNSSPGADSTKQQFAMGISKIGSVDSRFQVYKNPYMTENTILVGFRGSNFLETGAVYAPYVPLIMTPLVYDPSDFTPRKGVMTRYAKKMIRPEYYGKIHCSNLDIL